MKGLGSERNQDMPNVFTDEFLEWFEEEYGEDRENLHLVGYHWDRSFDIPLHWEEEDPEKAVGDILLDWNLKRCCEDGECSNEAVCTADGTCVYLHEDCTT